MKTSQKYLSLLGLIFTTLNIPQTNAQEAKINVATYAKAHINYVIVDNQKIAYKVIGKGKPVVFLQRFRGTLNDWDPVLMDAVAKKHQVIVFDAPGVGLSSGEVPLSITTMAKQAIDITSALGIEKASYAGWSMGGAVAQVIAINYPEKVDKLALLATGPSSNPDFMAGNPEFGIRARKPQYTFEDNRFLFFYNSPASDAACKQYLERIATITEKDVDVRLESYQNMTTALKEFKANTEQNYFEKLKNIKSPTLIANGKYDPSYPIINSLVFEREIPNSKLVIYPDAGHGFLFQYHAEFATELINFLK